MSDPLGNSEIEDVLSSIRRLVAGDHKGSQKNSLAVTDPGLEDEDIPEEGEALVLTPCLRVEEVATPDADTALWEADGLADHSDGADHAESTEPELASAEETEQDETLEDTFPGVENDSRDGEAAMFDEGEPELSEGDLPTFIRPIPSESADEDSRDLDTEAPDVGESASEDVASNPERAVELPQRNVPRSGFLFGMLQEDEDSGEPATANAEPFAEESNASGDAAEPGMKGGVDTLDTDPVQPDDAPEPQFVHRSDERLLHEDRPAEPAPVFVRRHVDESPEEEADETDDVSPNLFAADDQLLDEKALRAMVSEMLHRELQGALGERITRNVRKLVRREIHRALATRDFE